MSESPVIVARSGMGRFLPGTRLPNRHQSETDSQTATTKAMTGVACGYPWKYRPLEDHLVVMTACHVFKLKVYENVGHPQTRTEVQQYAEDHFHEDIVLLKREERHQRGTTSRQDDPNDDKVWFRSRRVFHTDAGWHVGTREGNLGPFPDKRLAVIELQRYVKESIQQELSQFNATFLAK